MTFSSRRRCSGVLDNLSSRQTSGRVAGRAVEQAPRAGQPMLVHHPGEVGGFGGVLHGPAAGLRIQPVDEEHVVAEAAEAEQILKKHPGVSAGARPAPRERARDQDTHFLRRGVTTMRHRRQGSPGA